MIFGSNFIKLYKHNREIFVAVEKGKIIDEISD